MKQSISKAMSAAALLAVVFSCQKNHFDQNSAVEKSEPVMRTFKCVIASPDDPETKLAINASDGKTTWEVGDKIYIHGERIGVRNKGKSTEVNYGTTVSLAAGDISADGRTATITFAVDNDGKTGIKPYVRDGYSSTFYAGYPAEAVLGVSKEEAAYNIEYYTTFVKFDSPLMAAYNKDDTFVFYNLGSLISFSLPNTEDVDSYVLTGADGTETVSYGQFGVKLAFTSSDEEEKSIPYFGSKTTTGEKKSLSGSVVCNGSTHYIFIPAGVNLPNGLKMYFLKNGTITRYLSTKAVDLRLDGKKGKYLKLGNISAYLHDYSAPATKDLGTFTTDEANAATDLSDPKSANCYVVNGGDAGNANKIFKFKAYKGNSTESVGVVTRVKVLWQTNNTSTVLGEAENIVETVDFRKTASEKPYEILFKMPSSLIAGNAVIAAYGPGNEILWSWHIWVPSSAVTTEDGTSFCGTTYIQDRNLGALTVTPASEDVPVTSIGLYYQWGRKDPFPGATSFAESPSGAKVKGTQWTTHSNLETAAYTVENPTQFIHTYGEDSGYWDREGRSDLWNAAGNKKSIYDPCPPGYRVPLFNSSLPLWDSSAWTRTTNRIAKSGFVFPEAGWLDCYGGSYAYSNKRVMIWSAEAESSSKGKGAQVREGARYAAYYYKAKACSVRCVSE